MRSCAASLGPVMHRWRPPSTQAQAVQRKHRPCDDAGPGHVSLSVPPQLHPSSGQRSSSPGPGTRPTPGRSRTQHGQEQQATGARGRGFSPRRAEEERPPEPRARWVWAAAGTAAPLLSGQEGQHLAVGSPASKPQLDVDLVTDKDDISPPSVAGPLPPAGRPHTWAGVAGGGGSYAEGLLGLHRSRLHVPPALGIPPPHGSLRSTTPRLQACCAERSPNASLRREAALKLVAFGFRRFFKDRWNQLDLAIVLLSIVGIALEEIETSAALPVNPTIIRIMRVLRIARVLKLLKMATGMRALLDTVVQALPQVGNLGLLFMLLFFIYAALGVELFGRLECSEDNPCEGLSRHATFSNFGMAFLTLFRVSTGDNWNGIMKDTLRECTHEDRHCLSYLPALSPVYFVTFVLVAQFVLVNVVVAVLMKHLEESNKEAREDAEMDAEIELEMAQEPPAGPDADAPPSPRESPDAPSLLAVRKVSVSRMLSLPNDSYMFRPVAPASARHPHPLQEVETETRVGGTLAGSATPAHSPPPEPCASLQVPLAASSPARGSDTLRAPSPRGNARSPSLSRPLCRQEAMHTESLEGRSDSPGDSALDSKEPEKTPVRQVSLGGSSRPPSVRTRKHTFGQHCVSSQPPAPGRDEAEAAEATDPADEEVSHITGAAHAWSPPAEPHGPGVSGGERTPCRRCSVDAQGFLDRPGRAEEQRWSAAEPGGAEDGLESGEAKARGLEAEPALGTRRKKKMSPPCISVDPPAEDEGSTRPPAAEGTTTLRRRTPSCEAAPHRDALEPTEGPGAGGDPAARGERWGPAPCWAEHLTVPSFAFKPLDLGGPGGDPFLHSGHGLTPEPRASSGAAAPLEPQETEPPVPSGDPPEKMRGLYLTVPQPPMKKLGSPPATPTPGEGADEPV
ncbi:PREDICTED: voltage-dependent T-type calcium channel subunit alpha-1H-like [Propithecus coquereli]|uniref:voltage-dependent T-type calcium channel subunit alpha-1H-like n=1 Tax=Propithecus coquereli TaxID=379532 RepID=UPI00063F48DC|nr:PREDICTED: voltage-dependent T-type calcium channel subunit alpha-1H-like [Propithecus coquereli]